MVVIKNKQYSAWTQIASAALPPSLLTVLFLILLQTNEPTYPAWVGIVLWFLFIATISILFLRAYDFQKKEQNDHIKKKIASIAFDSSDAILIADAATIIIDVNNSFCQITGYQKSEIKGKKTSIFKSDHHDKQFYDHMWNSINTSGRWSGEMFGRKKDGTTYIKWISIEAVKDRNNNIANYVSKFRDITKKRTANKIAINTNIENGLRDAISRNEMELYFQPIVNHDGAMFGAEALLRWNLNGEAILPLNFIPVAEETGLIIQIGAWVLKDACDHIHKWEEMKILNKDFVLSVNISPTQLSRTDFIDTALSVISDSGIDACRIKMEITESSIIENMEDAIVKINTLRKAGVEVVMDDFGTGYSSLSCLRRLPISQIKIDKSFVDNIEHDWDDEAIVRIIASLGRTLRVSVLAEGVENERQCRMLEMAGCSFFQGHHFGRPMPAAEFEKLLDKQVIKH